MNFLAIVTHIRPQDAIDMLFLTVVAYHLYLWFQGTKAFKALVGLLALGIIYTAAQLWGLFLTTWMLQILWQVLIILLIILFQSEIRQVLERINPFRAFGWRKLSRPAAWIKDFAEACFMLAKRNLGALIIIERIDKVEEMITGGLPLEGEPRPELLLSIFQKASLLHDGAAVIQEGRVVRVGTYLPLSSAEGLPSIWGTRHRAAVGLSERCDAYIVAVSEERSEVSLARSGQMTRVDTADELSRLIRKGLKQPTPSRLPLLHRLRSLAVNRWRLKLGMLGLISALWLLFAGQQNFQVTLQVPLVIENLPPELEIVQPINPTVRITIRGLRKDASTVNPDRVIARLDLFLARFGRTVFRIAPNQIILPNQQVDIVKIDPEVISFEFRKKKEEPPVK